MLTLITGGLGSGKSLMSVILSLIEKSDHKRIVSNFDISNTNEKFQLKKFLKRQYNDCMIILDEVYQYIDSRNSLDSQNKFFSYILYQSRKKSLDLYIIAQQQQSIDIRFRDLTDYIIYCKKLRDGFYYVLEDIAQQTNAQIKLSFQHAEQFFPYYDTNEVIFETDNFYISQDEIAEYCETIAKEIIEAKTQLFIPKNEKDKLKISKADIRIYCAEKEVEKKHITLIADYVLRLLSEKS